MSRPTTPKNTASSKILLGIVLVLLSAIGLATQNVVSRLFFVPGFLFDAISLGGWLSPQISNIVMLLAIRMAAMALLLASVAPLLYSRTFIDIRHLTTNVKLLGCVVGSGLCLFAGLTSLYFALSQVAAGIAIASFFIYPAITLLLAWRFLQQRPRAYHLGFMLVIFLGVALTTLGQSASSSTNPSLGIFGGLLAGLSFGLYGIFAEVALQPSQPSQALHPVPFSLVTFIVVAALASLSLLFISPIAVSPASWQPILLMTLFSAIITVVAYVLNNFGIRLIGASLTALISASTPALTALFAWGALQEGLRSQQIIGVGVVTIGVAALSLKAKGKR